MNEFNGMNDPIVENGLCDDPAKDIDYIPPDMTRAEYLKLIHEYNLPDAGNSGTH